MRLTVSINKEKKKEIQLTKELEIKINDKKVPVYVQTSDIDRTNYFKEAGNKEVNRDDFTKERE